MTGGLWAGGSRNHEGSAFLKGICTMGPSVDGDNGIIQKTIGSTFGSNFAKSERGNCLMIGLGLYF